MSAAPLTGLREKARTAAQHAHTPFSGEKAAAALLLSDGTWAPGVRVESASFSLTIAPALNAYTTAVAAERPDVVAAAFSRPVQRVERAFLDDLTDGAFQRRQENACALEDASLPPLGDRLDPFLQKERPATPRDGVVLARAVAERARVPASHFPVGCVIETDQGLLPGVNVEPVTASSSTAWTHVLCAERNALGTACSYGLLGEGAEQDGRAGPYGTRPPDGDPSDGDPDEKAALTFYLSCPKDPEGSPCGACRQLLVELAPHGVLWMDRASGAPERASLPALLPGSFRGTALPRNAPSA